MTLKFTWNVHGINLHLRFNWDFNLIEFLNPNQSTIIMSLFFHDINCNFWHQYWIQCILHVSIGTIIRPFYVTAPLIFWQRQDSFRYCYPWSEMMYMRSSKWQWWEQLSFLVWLMPSASCRLRLVFIEIWEYVVGSKFINSVLEDVLCLQLLLMR